MANDLIAKVQQLLTELKRRHVYRATVVYVGASWVLFDVAAGVAEDSPYLPDGAAEAVATVAILGFPVMLVLAWLYDITPSGIQRDPGPSARIEVPAGADRTTGPTRQPPQKKGLVTTAIVVVCLAGVWATWNWVVRPSIAPPVRPEPKTGPDPMKVAVLPLNDMTGKNPMILPVSAEREADGRDDGDLVTYQLINALEHLARLTKKDKDLRIVSLRSVMRYKDATEKGPVASARELGAGTFLEGTLANKRHKGLVVDLRLGRITSAEQTAATPEPLGEYQVTPEYALRAKLPKVVGDIAKAMGVEADPDYARAHAGRANAHILLAYLGAQRPAAAYKEARAAAKKAAELAESPLAEAHAARAYVEFAYEWDWDEAEIAFKRALKANPNDVTSRHWYGWFLMSRGAFDEAVEHMRIAAGLDPAVAILDVSLGWCAYYRGDYEKAIRIFRKVLADHPDFALTKRGLGLALQQREPPKTEQAVEALKEAVAPQRSADAARTPGPPVGNLGYVYAAAGKEAKAREQLQRMQSLEKEQYVPRYFVAQVHAGLSEDDKAIEALQRAYEERSEHLTLLSLDPVFAACRDHPRFQDLVDRIERGGKDEGNGDAR